MKPLEVLRSLLDIELTRYTVVRLWKVEAATRMGLDGGEERSARSRPQRNGDTYIPWYSVID
jgi:hypothetical protein